MLTGRVGMIFAVRRASHTLRGCQSYPWYNEWRLNRGGLGLGERGAGMGNRGRAGVFLLSLYADRRSAQDVGELERMVVWPQGEVSVVEAVAVVKHLARAQDAIITGLLQAVKELQESGALDEYRLSSRQAEGGQGSRFDAAA
jgi:hypothetical protein